MIRAQVMAPLAMQGGMAKTMSGLVGLNGIAALLAFAAQIVVARALGPEAYGSYSFLFATSSILALCSTFGLDTLATRLSASESADRSRGAGGAFMIRLLGLCIALGLLAGVIQFLVLAGSGYVPVDSLSLMMSAALVPLMAATNVSGGILVGLSRPTLALATNLLTREGLVLGLTAALSAAGVAIGAWTPLLGACVGCALGLALAGWVIVRHHAFPPGQASGRNLADLAPLIRAAAPIAGVTILYLLLNRLDLLLAAHYVEARELGIYAVAARCADALMLVQVAANNICGPRFAALYATNDLAGMQTLAIRVARLMMMAGTVGAVPLLLFPDEFLSIFGSDFVEGSLVLRLLLAAKLLVLGFGCPTMLHHMTDRSHHMIPIIGCAIVGNLVLIPLIAPRFGILGVAAVTALTLLLICVASALSLRRILGVRSTGFDRIATTDSPMLLDTARPAGPRIGKRYADQAEIVLAKAERLWRLGLEHDFIFPRPLELRDNILWSEYLPDLQSIRASYLRFMRAPGRAGDVPMLCRDVGATLGAIHDNLRLPEPVTWTPPPAFDRAATELLGKDYRAILAATPQRLLHCDFGFSNIHVTTRDGRRRIVILDAEPNGHSTLHPLTIGSIYIDIAAFALCLYGLVPLRHHTRLPRSRRQALLGAFLAGYQERTGLQLEEGLVRRLAEITAVAYLAPRLGPLSLPLSQLLLFGSAQ
jgi:O-antigen/teichoic acid export membrane protein